MPNTDMPFLGILYILENQSFSEKDITNEGGNEAFHSVVFFVYQVVCPMIFVFVILILLWYIVLSIFR